MKRKILYYLIICGMVVLHSCSSEEDDYSIEYPEGYLVKKISSDLQIDANWSKPQWSEIDSIRVDKVLWIEPEFVPKTYAKLMYDDENLYVIFKVEDKYVQCLANEINGSVWKDACVELFFAPDTAKPLQYFNLEINCGGTPLLFYSVIPKDFTILTPEEIGMIEIAATLPDYIYPEITADTTWYIEYKLPFEILKKYSNLTKPSSAVVWKANLYKTASGTSNRHYLAWKTVDTPNPDFHQPGFFGNLVFE